MAAIPVTNDMFPNNVNQTNFYDNLRHVANRTTILERSAVDTALPSSIRFKENVEALDVSLEDVDQIQLKRWVFKDFGKEGIGVIAEEIDELPSLRQFVEYEKNPLIPEEIIPRRVQTDLMLAVAGLVTARNAEQQISNLEAVVEAQQTQIDELTAAVQLLLSSSEPEE